jgi:hypothetical protein
MRQQKKYKDVNYHFYQKDRVTTIKITIKKRRKEITKMKKRRLRSIIILEKGQRYIPKKYLLNFGCSYNIFGSSITIDFWSWVLVFSTNLSFIFSSLLTLN